MDCLALSRIRTGDPPDGLERLPADRGRQPLYCPSEWRGDPRFHRSDAEIVRRLHRAAASLRRARGYAIQGYIHPGFVETLAAGRRNKMEPTTTTDRRNFLKATTGAAVTAFPGIIS